MNKYGKVNFILLILCLTGDRFMTQNQQNAQSCSLDIYITVLPYLLTYLILIYSLTPFSRVLLEKLTGFQLLKKFLTFYGNQSFITAFTRPCHIYIIISHLIWSQIIKDRRVWSDLTQKTTTHVRLQCQKKKKNITLIIPIYFSPQGIIIRESKYYSIIQISHFVYRGHVEYSQMVKM